MWSGRALWFRGDGWACQQELLTKQGEPLYAELVLVEGGGTAYAEALQGLIDMWEYGSGPLPQPEYLSVTTWK